jgi:hypothetical protein
MENKITLVTHWEQHSSHGDSWTNGWVFYIPHNYGNVVEIVEEIRDKMYRYTEPNGWRATYPGQSFGHPIDIQWHEGQRYAIVTQFSGLDV